MIYEMRTYTLKPGSVPEWEATWAKSYPTREKYSKLGAMFHTEIGPLNQIIHIWPYKDLQERMDIRGAAAKDASGLWPPPNTSHLVETQESDIIEPVKGMADWTGPQSWGEVYELRTYTYAPGDFAKAFAAFGEAYEGRNGIYPVAGIFGTVQGNLNKLHQLFPYKSFAHREEVRSAFRAAGVWPPHAEVRPQHQLVRFLIPAAVSPIH